MGGAGITLLICYRQTSTLQTHRLDYQQNNGSYQNEQLAIANQGVKTSQQTLNTHIDLLLPFAKVVNRTSTQENTRELQDIVLEVLKTTLEIYNMILNLQMNLPRQVERERPVILLDACGRFCPVHLDFINSAEAFLAELKVRFKDVELQKIQRGQFVLENTQTKRSIDLRRPWHTCMLPGPRIDMSMIFSQADVPRSTCPGCRYDNTTANTEDVEWYVGPASW